MLLGDRIDFDGLRRCHSETHRSSTRADRRADWGVENSGERDVSVVGTRWKETEIVKPMSPSSQRGAGWQNWRKTEPGTDGAFAANKFHTVVMKLEYSMSSSATTPRILHPINLRIPPSH